MKRFLTNPEYGGDGKDGSWNRSPLPQAGYNVTFQPMANGKATGDFEVLADGFTGKSPLMNPGDAVARPDGVAQAPDGSLYISESQKGKIWRVCIRVVEHRVNAQRPTPKEPGCLGCWILGVEPRQSDLSATRGSTRVARRAGRVQAAGQRLENQSRQ